MRRSTTVLLISAAGVAAVAGAFREALPEDQVARCRAEAMRFLSEPALPPGLALGGGTFDAANDCVTFDVLGGGTRGRAGRAAQDERDRDPHGFLSYTASNSQIRTFRAPSYRGVLPDTILPAAQLEQHAREWAIRHHPVWSRLDGAPDLRVRGFPGYDRSASYAHLVNVDEYDERGLLPNGARVRVREFDGRIVGFEVWSGVLARPDADPMPRDRAVAAAERACRRDDRLRDRSLDLISAELGYTEGSMDNSGRGRLWAITFQVTPALDDRHDATVAIVTVVAATGTVSRPFIQSVGEGALRRIRGLPPVTSRASAFPQDGFPSWHPDGGTILFTSDRPRTGAPAWIERPRTAFVVSETGETTCLVAAPPKSASLGASWSPTRPYLVALWQHDVALLNTMTGVVRTLGDHYWSLPGHEPLWAADGEWLVVRVASQGRPRRYAVLRPEEKDPRAHEVIARGQIIAVGPTPVAYMACQESAEPGAEVRMELRKALLSADNVLVGDESVVLRGLAPIHQASLSADGSTMLLSCEDGAYVVDTGTWQRRALLEDHVHDPEHPDYAPLQTRHHVLNATGTRVAFSGWLRKDDKDPGGWYIYTCSVDGSQVRRRTQPVAGTHPLYVFPESGKTTNPAVGIPWLKRFPAASPLTVR